MIIRHISPRGWLALRRFLAGFVLGVAIMLAALGLGLLHW